MTRRDVAPFFRLFHWAANVPVDKAADRAVLVALVTLVDWDTLQGQPSHGRIAERTPASVATVKRSLCRLRDRGLIRWKARGATDSLMYELTPDALAQNELMDLDDSHSLKMSYVLAQNELHDRSSTIGGESLDVNGESARREACGNWSVGPYRFPARSFSPLTRRPANGGPND